MPLCVTVCFIGTLDRCELSPLFSGDELTGAIIAHYQYLLKCQYNAVGGLEDPAYGMEYDFSTQRGSFIQVLHVNFNHWIVVSNTVSKQGMQCICVAVYSLVVGLVQ